VDAAKSPKPAEFSDQNIVEAWPRIQTPLHNVVIDDI